MKLVAGLCLLSILISLFVKIPVSEAVLDLSGELQCCVCPLLHARYRHQEYIILLGTCNLGQGKVEERKNVLQMLFIKLGSIVNL